MHTMVKLFFFPDEQDRFFSYTETADEISLVMDTEVTAQLTESLKEDEYSCSPFVWRAIEFYSPSLGTDTGIVERISRPLSCAGITIFYLSTMQSDMCLIPASLVSMALAALAASEGVRLQLDDLDDELLKDLEAHRLREQGIVSEASQTPSATEGASSASTTVTLAKSDSLRSAFKHPLKRHNAMLQLCSLRREEVSSISLSLMQLFFYPQDVDKLVGCDLSKERVVMFTEKEKVISLLFDERLLRYIPDRRVLSLFSVPWAPIQVIGSLGFAESGIVNTLASPLSRQGINLFYLSTYETDLIFVPAHVIDEAMEVLRKHGFNCQSTHS